MATRQQILDSEIVRDAARWNRSVRAAPAGEYALATGAAAVRRLLILHRVCSPASRRAIKDAGLQSGMRVADFGCGIGAVTRMFAAMVGPHGHVTGIDTSSAQLEQAAQLLAVEGLHNGSFHQADAGDTGLAADSFDFVYCRFLLLHLADPRKCLREMRRVLKPGGILFVEDGDLASATSQPPTRLHAFAELFSRLGPTRGLNYSLSRNLYHLVKEAGFAQPDIVIHQPALTRGDERFLLKWSVEEAGEAFIGAGLITREALQETLREMQRATDDPEVLVLGPRMSLVWARK